MFGFVLLCKRRTHAHRIWSQSYQFNIFSATICIEIGSRRWVHWETVDKQYISIWFCTWCGTKEWQRARCWVDFRFAKKNSDIMNTMYVCRVQSVYVFVVISIIIIYIKWIQLNQMRIICNKLYTFPTSRPITPSPSCPNSACASRLRHVWWVCRIIEYILTICRRTTKYGNVRRW